jgi:hypothetical protein
VPGNAQLASFIELVEQIDLLIWFVRFLNMVFDLIKKPDKSAFFLTELCMYPSSHETGSWSSRLELLDAQILIIPFLVAKYLIPRRRNSQFYAEK